MSFYNEIIPNLFLGSVEASKDYDFIENKKISIIVNCSKDLKNEYQLNLLKPIEEAPLEIQEWLYNNSYYIKYYRIPVDDNGKDNEIPSSRGRRQNESSEENVMKRQKNANDLIKTKGDVYKKSDEYRRLMAIINKLSTSEGTEQLQLSRVVNSFMTAIRSSTSSLSQSIDVTEDDVEAMLYMLEKDNKILVVDDTINIV
jgi:hypothetical protein